MPCRFAAVPPEEPPWAIMPQRLLPRCRCKRKAVAVAAPHPALPFPWNAPAKKECWDDAVYESPSKGSRERRLLRPPATTESPSAAPFSAVHAAHAVHDGTGQHLFPILPPIFPLHAGPVRPPLLTTTPNNPPTAPLAMTTFAKLTQVADHRCWAASSLGSIANRSDEPGEPVLIPLPCYL